MPYNNTGREFPLGAINNPLTDNLYNQDYSDGIPTPPISGDRWITNNGDFVITNNSDYIIFNP